MGKGYDPKCYELAEYFLTDRPELEQLRKALAQEVQDAVESFIESQAQDVQEQIERATTRQ